MVTSCDNRYSTKTNIDIYAFNPQQPGKYICCIKKLLFSTKKIFIVKQSISNIFNILIEIIHIKN